MKRKRLGVILVVVGALLAIGVGVIVYMQTEQTNEIAKQTPTVEVVVATLELPERVAIPANALAVAKLPADLVPPGAIVKPSEAVGKFPLARMYKNEVVIQSKLADKEGKAGPAFALKEGFVAVTLAGSDLLTPTGAVRTGDKVDILLTLPLPKLPGTAGGAQGSGSGSSSQGQQAQAQVTLPQVTQTLLQNVEVLRIGNFPAAGQPDAGGGGGKSVTVQLDHQDALIMKWAKDSGGNMDLVLRHPADKEPVTTEAITANYIMRKFRFVLSEPLQDIRP